MKNRKKVILHDRNGWKNEYKLSLTQEQIDLLNWLLDEDLLSSDDHDIQVLDEADHWVEV